jgi:hypothetical protein
VFTLQFFQSTSLLFCARFFYASVGFIVSGYCFIVVRQLQLSLFSLLLLPQFLYLFSESFSVNCVELLPL